jgi:hypothetical protein
MAIDANQFEVIDDQPAATDGRFELVEDNKPNLSQLANDPYYKFKAQESAAVKAGLPLEDYSQSVPPSLNPNYDFTRATGGGIGGLAQKGLEVGGRLSKATIGDIAAGMRASPEFSGNIPAAIRGEELPMDISLSDAAQEAKFRGEKPTAATLGRISEGVAETAPMIPLIGGLPAAAQKLALAGFTAKMVSDAPGIATELGSELGKPKDQQDPDKISKLTSVAIQTVGFAALGGVGLKRSMAPEAIPSIQGPTAMGSMLKMPEGAEAPLNVERFEPLDVQSGSPLSPQELIDRQSRAPTPPETPTPEVKTFNLDEETGGQDASQISKPASVPEPEVRPPVGEGTPLRQQGEAPGAQAQAVEPVARTGDARGEPNQESPQVGAAVSDFITKHQSSERLSNTETDRVGLQVKSVSDLDSLADAWKKSKAEADDALAKSRAEKDPKEKLKILEAFQKKNPPQYLREVIETATNTGSHVEGEGSASVKPLGERPLDWRNNPEAAEWLAKNAKDLGIKLPDDFQTQAGELVGMGGAVPSEFNPEGNEARDVYGIAHEVREARARAGQVESVPRGQGISAPDSVARGRQLIQSGVDPEKTLQNYEVSGRTSPDDFAVTRAHGEILAQQARAAERKFGTDSPEHKAAFDKLTDWDTRTKKMQTDWNKSGMAQQGQTDIDTGSFTGLAREFKSQTGKDLTPKQTKEAKDIAGKVSDAADKTEKAKNELFNQLDAESGDAKTITDAERRALDAANKTVRDAAARKAKADNDARVAKTAKEKKAAQDASNREQKAIDAANKVVRDAAARAAKAARAENVLKADTSAYAWKKAKAYIDQGITNFDDLRNKLATDLGMPVEKVTAALAKTKRAKYLTDELWKKQQDYRRLDQQAKRWLLEQQTPLAIRALRSIPNLAFAVKVFGHGTVALGTHAPMVVFQPRFWKAYANDFVKMYRMVGSTPFYENQIQDLVRRPNYTTARRAGLVNDPYQYEDYNSPEVTKWMGPVANMGNRGYSVLKILRQDMFDQMWNKLPKTTQIPEVAKAIADGVNHATGVVKMKAPPGSNIALFAPRLEASRAAWLVVDPIKAAHTFADWKNASEGDKQFAINQVKEKAWVVGTMLSLLAANEGVLEASNSNQRVNFNDPMKRDWLKFKVGGMNIGYGNAMLSMARLPARLYKIRESDGGKLKNLVYADEDTYSVLGEFARSQESPFASLATSLWFKSDWQNRPLPTSNRPVPKRLKARGVEAYTWPEFWTEQALPIPAEEAAREVWKSGLGMSPDQIAQARKAMATIAVMAATGARVEEDTDKVGP